MDVLLVMLASIAYHRPLQIWSPDSGHFSSPHTMATLVYGRHYPTNNWLKIRIGDKCDKIMLYAFSGHVFHIKKCERDAFRDLIKGGNAADFQKDFMAHFRRMQMHK